MDSYMIAFDTEFVAEGYSTVTDLYFGVTNFGPDKITETIVARIKLMAYTYFHLKKKDSR
jgi:hypothetical protein